MATAQITTTDGIKVTVDGTPQEVAEIVDRLKIRVSPDKKTAHQVNKHESKSKATPINLIIELIDGGFFKKPKGLSTIKITLEEQGHYYPVTSLSPALIRLVRKRSLRRIKDNKRWLYVN